MQQLSRIEAVDAVDDGALDVAKGAVDQGRPSLQQAVDVDIVVRQAGVSSHETVAVKASGRDGAATEGGN